MPRQGSAKVSTSQCMHPRLTLLQPVTGFQVESVRSMVDFSLMDSLTTYLAGFHTGKGPPAPVLGDIGYIARPPEPR